MDRRQKIDAFLSGIASINLFGSPIHNPYSDLPPNVADYEALRKDWEAIGGDMWAAIERFERENMGAANRGEARE